MAQTKTPAPRRSGNSKDRETKTTLAALRMAMKQLEHDPEALGLVVQVVETLASRSPRRRR